MSLWPAVASAQPDSEVLEQLQRQVDALKERLDEAEERRREDAEKIEALQRELEELTAREAEVPAPERAPATLAERLNVFNPRLTVFGNGLLRVDDRKVFVEDDGDLERIDDRFSLRETELDLRGAIDPYADGVVITALEEESPGEFEVSVEEGYASIKNLPFLEAPPLGLRLKVGRFRTEFGRINRLHTHDLPQSTRPLVVESFLGREGHIADGASGRILLPSLLDDESAWELTLQAFQGGDIAVAEDGTNDPAFLANLRWSRTFADTHFADISGIFSYGDSDPEGERSVATYSIDALYKWKPLRGGEWRSLVLGGQVFYSDREFVEAVGMSVDGDDAGLTEDRTSHPVGYFLFGQYQFTRRLFAGLRWDWTEAIANDDAERMAVQPYATYYFSEFLRLRLGWQHLWSDFADEDGLDTLFGEVNFVFGGHPPEPFWVNR
jgi:hypothetical protein